MKVLRASEFLVRAHPTSLDIEIEDLRPPMALELQSMGAVKVGEDKVLFTSQPSITVDHMKALLAWLGIADEAQYIDLSVCHMPPMLEYTTRLE